MASSAIEGAGERVKLPAVKRGGSRSTRSAAKSGAKSVKSGAECVYQLKVTLDHVRPPIWRRVLVPSAITLAGLHDVLQIAMGWTDSHLHQFEFRGALYGKPVREYDFDVQDEARTRLDRLLVRAKDQMHYEYDFGDGWRHLITLEKVVTPESTVQLPTCIAGARACPPEDCGGAPGYAQLCEVLADPTHPEYEEMLEWVGEDYDPAFLDLDAVNRTLTRLKKRRRRS